jgi:hypothetical protein
MRFIRVLKYFTDIDGGVRSTDTSRTNFIIYYIIILL